MLINNFRYIFDFESLPSEEHPDRNEDAAAYDNEKLWSIVCDGVGGSVNGGLAARITRDTVSRKLSLENPRDIQQAQEILKTAFIDAETDILTQGKGSQTTAIAVKIVHMDETPYLAAASVGDSRLYLYRSKSVTQISKDDNMIPDAIARRIDEERNTDTFSDRERKAFLVRNIIAQAIGQDDGVVPHVYSFPVIAGDIYVLTSDGVHDNLVRPEIENITANSKSIAKDLVKLALEFSKKESIRSKPDDMTVISISVL